MSRVIVLWIGCLVIGVTFGELTYASEIGPQQTEASNTSMVVKVATGSHYAPFVSDELPQGGWSQAIVLKVLEKMQIIAKVDVLPWDRALLWTEKLRYFGTYPYVYSPSRADKFLYSDAINHVPIRLFVSKASGITHLQQLMGARFCLPHGYSIDTSETSLVAQYQLNLNQATDGDACIAQVQKGWSDVGLLNGYVDVQRIQRHHQGELMILEEDLGSVALHFIIAKSQPNAHKWMQHFNKALADITQSGARANIDSIFQNILKR